MTRILAGLALCAVSLALFSAPASAALQICNRTSYVIYAAAGWRTPSDNVTQGWTRLVPGSCGNAVTGDLTAKAYFIYARSSQAHSGAARAWGGTAPLCVKDTNFALKTPATTPSCIGDDTFTLPFAPLDTHAMRNWTTTLTESGAITTDDAARAAGYDRLLNDIGIKTGSAKARDDALARFRARAKLAPKASPADVFDALETEAMKAVSPAGYSICNDTAGGIWAALAFRDGKQSLAAGWWKVPPGACAHALTEALKIDKVFVHAEGHNKPLLVSGKEKFCITNITFQVTGDGDCRKRGLTEAGFALTSTHGAPGYTVHIGNDGIEPSFAR